MPTSGAWRTAGSRWTRSRSGNLIANRGLGPFFRTRYFRNGLIAVFLECSWAFGIWLSHPFTIIPNFLLRLGASTTLIGCLMGLRVAGSGLFVFAVSAMVAHRRSLGPFLGRWHYVAALPHLGLALLAVAADKAIVPAWVLLAAGVALSASSSALIGGQLPAYFVLLSRLTPESVRGKFFGILFSTATFVAMLGPYLASRQFTGSQGEFAAYGKIFGCSFLVLVAGTTGFFFLRERSVKPNPHRNLVQQLTSLIDTWKQHARLRRYLLARMWLSGGLLAIMYLATYSKEEALLDTRALTLLGSVMMVSQGVGSLMLGWMGSPSRARFPEPGARGLRMQMFNMMALVAALLFAAAGPAHYAVLLLAAAAGFLIAGDLALQPNILMSLGPVHLRTDIMSLSALALLPVVLVVALLSGFAIDVCGHRPVFAVAALFGLVGCRKLFQLLREASIDKQSNPLVSAR